MKNALCLLTFAFFAGGWGTCCAEETGLTLEHRWSLGWDAVGKRNLADSLSLGNESVDALSFLSNLALNLSDADSSKDSERFKKLLEHARDRIVLPEKPDLAIDDASTIRNLCNVFQRLKGMSPVPECADDFFKSAINSFIEAAKQRNAVKISGLMKLLLRIIAVTKDVKHLSDLERRFARMSSRSTRTRRFATCRQKSCGRMPRRLPPCHLRSKTLPRRSARQATPS